MAKPSSYRIGVISDTHDRWMPRVAELFKDVDEIWHLGDVCEQPILDTLRAINGKLTVVLGNNDSTLSSPLSLNLERDGERFLPDPHPTPAVAACSGLAPLRTYPSPGR